MSPGVDRGTGAQQQHRTSASAANRHTTHTRHACRFLVNATPLTATAVIAAPPTHSTRAVSGASRAEYITSAVTSAVAPVHARPMFNTVPIKPATDRWRGVPRCGVSRLPIAGSGLNASTRGGDRAGDTVPQSLVALASTDV